MRTQPGTGSTWTARACLLLATSMLVAIGAAGTSSGQDPVGVRFSFGSVRIGPDQTIVLRVTYPPRDPSRAGVADRLKVVADFDLFAAAPGAARDARERAVSIQRFVERRSVEAVLFPGEAVSIGIGDEMFSGFSASHLSLLGPSMAELERRGITVTGELTTHVGGRTLTILKPECENC